MPTTRTGRRGISQAARSLRIASPPYSTGGAHVWRARITLRSNRLAIGGTIGGVDDVAKRHVPKCHGRVRGTRLPYDASLRATKVSAVSEEAIVETSQPR